MKIKNIYDKFPTNESCLILLEKIYWDNAPRCPYCKSKSQSPLPKERRYHCNSCKTTFRVTVNTIFHKSKIDLQKWFMLIWLYFNSPVEFTVRQIGEDLLVTKDTAWLMLKKIKMAEESEKEKLKSIINAF